MPTIQKAFKFAYYPSKSVKTKLRSAFGAARWIYNHYLNLQIANYREWQAKPEESRGTPPYMTYVDMAKHLTQLKREDSYSWLNNTGSVILQESLKQLEVAYRNFFRTRQGFPVFKSRDGKRSISMTYRGFGYRDNTLYINRKPLRLRGGRDIEGKPLRLTIAQSTDGKYSVTVISAVEMPIVDSATAKTLSLGIDMGIKDWAVDSTGQSHALPSSIPLYQAKLKVQQRKLAPITETLKPMRQAPITDPLKVELNRVRSMYRVRISRIHRKIVNIRTDWIHKLTARLVHTYRVITVESLDIVEMVKSCKSSRTLKHNLPRLIHSASWGEFFRQLTYKAAWSGNTTLVRSGKYFPSTQICNGCGTQARSKIPLQERRWWCSSCGAHNDRDRNAANNLNSLGVHALTLLRGMFKPLMQLKVKSAIWI